VALVDWSRRALQQLKAIRAHIAEDNPYAARRVFLKIVAATDSLTFLPDRGRLIGEGRRELTHVRPYLIRYRVKGTRVEILEVRHAARPPG